MSDHGHSSHGAHASHAVDPLMRDPDSKLVAQIGAVSAVLVLATVFAIQGLYFYFQHIENEHKSELYGPAVAGVVEQKASLKQTDVLDKQSGRLQLQINVAHDLVQQELAKDQEDQ